MADFKLPELGENVTTGDVLRVLVKPGDTVTFSIQYQNTGSDATNVVITDVVPTGSTLVAGSTGTGTVSGTTITWTLV